MRRMLIGFVFVIGIIACKTQKTKVELENIQLPGGVEIQMPKGSKVVDTKGIDSYTGYLITPAYDTFEIEFGESRIIYDLYNPGPLVISITEKDSIIKNTGNIPSGDEVIFSQNVEQDRGQNIFDRQFYLYDSSNSLIKKIVQPKNVGQGVTGVNVQGLTNGKSMTIFAKNLDSAKHRMAIQAFKSMKKNQ